MKSVEKIARNQKIIINVSNGPGASSYEKKEELKKMGFKWASLNGMATWLIYVGSIDKAKDIFKTIVEMGLHCDHELEDMSGKKFGSGEYLDELVDYYDELISF